MRGSYHGFAMRGPPHPAFSRIEPQSLGSTREREHKLGNFKTCTRQMSRWIRKARGSLAGASVYGIPCNSMLALCYTENQELAKGSGVICPNGPLGALHN